MKSPTMTSCAPGYLCWAPGYLCWVISDVSLIYWNNSSFLISSFLDYYVHHKHRLCTLIENRAQCVWKKYLSYGRYFQKYFTKSYCLKYESLKLSENNEYFVWNRNTNHDINKNTIVSCFREIISNLRINIYISDPE